MTLHNVLLSPSSRLVVFNLGYAYPRGYAKTFYKVYKIEIYIHILFRNKH
jgi:hypothetical protein